MGGGASQATGKTPEKAHGADINGWAPPEDEVQWLRRALEQEKKEKEWLMTRFEHQATFSTSCSKSAANWTPDSAAFRRMQEELALLRKALDAEKVEKEWIMKRFERVEADLQTRTQECANLRTQLSSASSAQAAPVVALEQLPVSLPVAPTHLPSLTPSKEQSKDQEPPKLPGAPLSPVVSPDNSPNLTPDSLGRSESRLDSLKARRGLKLTVQTNKEGQVSPKDSVKKMAELAPLQTTPVQKVQSAPVEEQPKMERQNSDERRKELAPSKRQEFLQKLRDSGPVNLNEPMTACVSSKRSTWAAGTTCEEPMSPLLRRRRDTSRGTPNPNAQPLRALFEAQHQAQEPGALSIATVKVDKLEADVPCSPKVVPKRKNRESFNSFDKIEE